MRPFALSVIAILSTLLLVSPPSSAQEIDVINLLDSLYWERDFEQIISIATEKLEENNDTYYEVGLNYYLGNANYRSGNFTEALKITEENYIRSKQLSLTDSVNVKLAIDASQKLGDYSFQAEKFQQGIDALERGINLQEKHLSTDQMRLVKLYHKLGALYRIKNDFVSAQEKLEYGQKVIIPKLSDQNKGRVTPVYQAEMAEMYNDNNQPQRAIAIYKKMIQVAERDSNIARISIYNNNCGLAYTRLKDYSKAKYHFQKNLEANLQWQGPKTVRMINSYNHMALINTRLNHDSEALKYFKKTEELIIEVLGEDNVRLSDLYIATGEFHLDNGNLDEALAKFKDCKNIRAKYVDNDDLKFSDAQQLIGHVLVLQNELDAGISILQESAKNRKISAIEQDFELSKTYSFLYDAYSKKGNLMEAKKWLSKSFAAIKYNIADPLAFEKLGIPSGLINPLVRLIDSHTKEIAMNSSAVLEGQKAIEIAMTLSQYLRYNLDEISSRKILANDLKPLNNAIIDFYYAAYDKGKNTEYIDLAFATIEKSNNTFLYENLATKVKDAYKLPAKTRQKRKEILASISQKQSELNKSSSKDENHDGILSTLNQSKEDLYTLIEEIKTDHPKYYETIYNYPITDILNIQKKLSDKDVFVSYYFGSEDLYAISVDNKKVNFLNLANGNAIQSKIQNLISGIKNKNEIKNITSISNSLYTDLISKAELSNYEKLFVSGDDILGLLPFEVLNMNGSTSNTDQLIVNQYSATFMTTSSKNKKSGYGTLAIAPVFEEEKTEEYSSNLYPEIIRGAVNRYLPETENEVNTIVDLFNSKSFLKSKATKINFENNANGKSFLHLATHGFADQANPNKSCLYFAQSDSTEESGQLFAEDIAQMKLNADLVTLSACNTGTGKIQKGEGVASLGRAFAYAGCPNQVISLWAVNDKTTTELMTNFYTNLKEGQSKAMALKNAKSQYLETAPEILKHPYYWAGFVYYGSDTVLNQQSHFGRLALYGLFGLGLLLTGLFFRKKD